MGLRTTTLPLTLEVVARAPSFRGFVDLTPDLTDAIARSGLRDGCCVAFCAHTTCALLINEWEDGFLEDAAERIEALVPRHIYYAHDDLGRRTQNLMPGERANGAAHVTQMLVGATSHCIPVAGGRPLLGRWQRLLLLELDEPRDRTVLFHLFGSGE